MMRRSLFMMAMALAFTMNVNAVEIEVPAGQPPVPGADRKIPANAYENYSHINETAVKEVDEYVAYVKSHPRASDSLIAKINQEKPGYDKAVRLAEFSQSTVVLVHDNANAIRFSVPDVSIRGDVITSNTEKGPLYAVRSITGFLLVGPPHSKQIKGYEHGKYTYDNLKQTSWKFVSDAKEHVMYTEFTPSNSNHTYGITYGRSVTKNDPFQNRPAEVVMSNYIIPSIESLVGLDSYSKAESWGNFTYRIPKTAKLISQTIEEGRYEVRTYEDKGITIRVIRHVFKKDNIDRSSARPQILWFLDKYGDLDMPTQYATVWNNGLPGFLIDRQITKGNSYLRHYTKDSVYGYSYRILYDESMSLYNHKQLRDMIEYVDFDNTRTLQKEPQWRVDGTYKKQLEANSVYIPWYMKKIALYNQ